MTRRRTDILKAVADDVRMDQAVPPTAELPMVTCPDCEVDITDFDSIELSSHIRFHAHLAAAPHSIQSQSHLWTYRENPKVSSSGWATEFTSLDNLYPSRNEVQS